MFLILAMIYGSVCHTRRENKEANASHKLIRRIEKDGRRRGDEERVCVW